jgi:hypothetical protein
MSPKSKKYRRPINPSVPPAASFGSPLTPASTDGKPAQNTPATVIRSGQNNPNAAIPVPTAQAFVRDLAFIGLTTLIIVILMIIAYYVVPR